jgi:hypothetical protein
MLNDAGIPEPNFEQPPLQAAQTGYVPGWLKHTPSYESVAGGRSSEVIEYEGGLWPTFLYPPA